jgi:signal transduction histidine kinase
MAGRRGRPTVVRWLGGLLVSVALVAVVSGLIALLEPRLPASGLPVLHLLAVLPVALVWGTVLAAFTSILSVVVFAYLFAPPIHSIRGADSRDLAAIGCSWSPRSWSASWRPGHAARPARRHGWRRSSPPCGGWPPWSPRPSLPSWCSRPSPTRSASSATPTWPALTASRARIVATADQTRRRIERDLHDGAQQRLVSLALQLQAAQAAVPPELKELAAELEQVTAGLDGTLEELQEFARGIHPAILAEGGLGPALRTLARRSPVPVQLHLETQGRLPERIEVTAYYVVAEALTNAAKHANASLVRVEVDRDDGLVRLGIRDDGVGGADPARGSGLVGLKDRVEATGGTLRVESRPGQGTSLLAELPTNAGQPPHPA